MMTIYLSRSFPRSNSSFFLCSGNALKSEVLRLREDIFLMDAGLGTPRICMQDALTGVPINRTTRFENKVGFLDLVAGESPIKKHILERFFIDLVAGESLIKERAAARFKKLVGSTDVVAGEPLLLPRRFRKSRAWMKLNKIWRTNTKGLSQKAMSTIGPKVLIKFEVKEREEETFISRADFYDFKYNSFAGDLLPFNNKDKESTFEQYVKKVMNYDKLFESIEGLAKMIHEDTRLADHLKVDVIEILVTILGKSDNVYIQRSAAYILSRAKLDSCDTIIRGKAIAVLVDLLASKSFIIAVPAVVTLTRFACHFPEYLHVIIEKGALEAVHKVSQMVKDTTMMKNLAKFMAVVCRAKICPEKECLCLDIIERMIDAGFLHIERACYALQYLSYKRCIRIQDETIYKLTQLSW